MARIEPLPAKALYRSCDPDRFSFQTTAELPDLEDVIGQARAVDAVRFGIEIRRPGYNLFALGPAGVGKHSMVRSFLQAKAESDATPWDWCYVWNFPDPQKPRLLRMPAGRAAGWRGDMERMVEELRAALPAAFESEDYRARRQVIEHEVKERQEKAFDDLRRRAAEKGVAIARTPTGVIIAPLRQGELVGPEEFEALPKEEHERMEAAMAGMQQELQAAMRQMMQWAKEARDKLKGLSQEMAIFAAGHLIDTMRQKYAAFPEIVQHLDAVQRDVIDNVDEFLSPPESPLAGLGLAPPKGAAAFFRRYQVNVLVDHGGTKGAPVVFEDNPTYQNLVGQVEYISQMGALWTDFNLIRPGALHRANGGYLMLDARQVLSEPYAWEALKRCLRSSQIRIESLGQRLGLLSTASLEPEPIPLEVKVVLVGERLLYYLLSEHDPEFQEFFKVAADFEDHMERSDSNHLLYARLIGTLARSEGLLPFDRCAVARVLEQSSRMAGNAEKFSTQRTALTDLLREADYWARQADRPAVTISDVQQAVDFQTYRLDRLRERLLEQIRRGTILIDTRGAKTGQVNGLSVIELGQVAFGHPTRITARVRLGKGEVIDIEREVELGGPIHSKGVLILSSFLGARYSADHPLSLSASLVFEQSYSGVEGDSASSAELYALLSALSEIPVRQSLAVTGSVNQYGEVQAIGGVNQKIEGFFDVCKAEGLTGDQGVIIPASNVQHLMLRHDVVAAVKAGKFQVYAVRTIDEGIEILTGVAAGERDASGKFPEGTVNQLVEERLLQLAEERMAFAAAARPEGSA